MTTIFSNNNNNIIIITINILSKKIVNLCVVVKHENVFTGSFIIHNH